MTRRRLSTTLGILVILLIGFTDGTHHRKCAHEHCQCDYLRSKFICKGYNNIHLTYIPKPPKEMKIVILKNILIGNLTDAMTHNLTYCNLTSLTLSGNKLEGFSPTVFKELVHMETLVIEQLKLPITNLTDVFGHMNNKVRILSVTSTGYERKEYEIDSKIFASLVNLNELTLKLQRMNIFNATSLAGLQNLNRLDLSDNIIVTLLIAEPLTNVTLLNLNGNNLVEVPEICRENGHAIIPRLRDLRLQDNAIRDLDVSTLACLRNLEKLTLSQNRIERLRNNVFANLPKLSSLSLDRLWALKEIENEAFNSSSLRKLTFIYNPTLHLKNCNPRLLFKNTPNLEILIISNTKLNFPVIHLKEMLLNLKEIRKLILQHVGIQFLPPDTFSEMKYLSNLTLTGNPVSHWNQSVFGNVSSIRGLVLDGCDIKIITEDFFPWEFRKNVTEINLAHNPFTCTCDLLWFKTWMTDVMRNKSIIFTEYPLNYECRSPNTARLKLKNFNPTVKSCSATKLYSVILTIVVGVFLVFFVSSLVIYRYRWYVLYWISLMRRRRLRQGNHPAEILYDGFVSYSNPDYDWMSEHLMKYLEEQLNLRLCEHSRDFAVGRYITDNVIDAIDSSRKTILVISNEYMKSDWCRFELQMALDSFLNQEIELIVILLEHIQACHVTSSLRALMVSTTYIEWSTDTEGQHLFKQRLGNAFRNSQG